MPRFIDTRKRIANSSTEIMGTVTDAEDSSRHVMYENGHLGVDGELRGPGVNWSAHGTVSVADARRYAEQILAACEAAELPAREFEPQDEIDFPGLKDGNVALVTAVSDDLLEVEEFVPGDYDETVVKRYFNCSNDDVTRVIPEEWAAAKV
jgi:hypothetical protein